MSILDAGHQRSSLLSYSAMFGLQSVLGISQKTDPRQDSSSSASSKFSFDSKTPELTSRSSSTMSFLSRSSKRLSVEPLFELSCEVAVRPSFCWNSQQDTREAGSVWSQFETGLKSCQDDVLACPSFMGHKDAVFAGVFDGHGFNGRSAATYARKNIIRWLSVDTNATAKDPKKRLKAFEKVCSQISRGLARSELCGFDAQTSGLTTCFGLVQSNKACLASAGNCKAVLGRGNPDSPTLLHAILLTSPDGTQPRATSESNGRASGHGVRPRHSMPAASPLGAENALSSEPPEGLLGRGSLGEGPSVPPLMSVHQLSSQDQFLIMGTSGLWQVMTPQEAVDFVHQCRQCRPDNLSCSEALTLEAHTRWKLRFSKVIAEDVAAVIIHCGALPTPAKPAHRLPAFPDAASSNHDANDEHTLHETREFWGRLQPESLVPLLQSASSKGKGRMPSSYLPIESSSAGKAKRHLPSGQLPIRRPSPSLSFPSQPSQSDPEAASSSHSGPRDSLLARNSSNYSTYHESSGHSSSARDASVGGRSVHFALPAGSDSDDDDQLHGVVSGIDDKFGKGKGVLDSKQRDGNFHAEARMSKRSPPLDISFRPDTPDVASDLTPRIVSSSGRSSTLSSEFPYETPKASSPPDDRQALQEPCASPLPRPPQNPFAAAAMASASFTDVSDTESESHFSTPRSSFDLQDPRHSASHASSRRPARAVPKSPKSPGRAHAHQPLDESEGEKSLLAKLSMMERTHSAPGGVPFGMLVDLAGSSRPRRRLPVSIPEDRPMATAPAAEEAAEEADSVSRPFRKIYPQGSGDSDASEADVTEASLSILPPSLSKAASSSMPKSQASSALHEGRVHSKAYPTSSELLSGNWPRIEFPKSHAPVFSAPEWAVQSLEGQIRGGFPRVASHPENLADLAATAAPAAETHFARRALQTVSAQSYSLAPSSPSAYSPPLTNLVNATSSTTARSNLDPWASPTQHGGDPLSKSKRTLLSALGNRSRNSSAAFDELTRLRSRHASDDHNPAHEPVSSSM